MKKAVDSVRKETSDRKAAKRLGVAPRTVKEWREAIDEGRAAEIPPLREGTRTKLRNKLLGSAGDGGGGRAGGGAHVERAAPQAVDFDDLMEEMRTVLRDQSLSPSMRGLLLDIVGGNLRSAALLDEGFNARLRIQAIRESEANGKHRADVIERVEEGLTARALELHRDRGEVSVEKTVRAAKVVRGGVAGGAAGRAKKRGRGGGE